MSLNSSTDKLWERITRLVKFRYMMTQKGVLYINYQFCRKTGISSWSWRRIRHVFHAIVTTVALSSSWSGRFCRAPSLGLPDPGSQQCNRIQKALRIISVSDLLTVAKLRSPRSEKSVRLKSELLCFSDGTWEVKWPCNVWLWTANVILT